MIGYVFKRYEMKYLLTEKQYEAVKAAFCDSLVPDRFAKTTIQSLYYDTADNRLIRASLEKPTFKEKLRLRCYGLNDCDKDVFVEMKRKYDGVVYKRRITCKELQAQAVLGGASDTQIGKELEYFARFYGELYPKMLIIYDLEAFCAKQGEEHGLWQVDGQVDGQGLRQGAGQGAGQGDLRITFDTNIRYRTDNLNFYSPLSGKELPTNEKILMEIKTGTALPLWLCAALDKERIYKTTFSKYGTAYKAECEKNNQRSTELCLNQSSQTERLPLSAFSSY